MLTIHNDRSSGHIRGLTPIDCNNAVCANKMLVWVDHVSFVPKAQSAPPPTLHYPSHGGGEVLCRLCAVFLGAWWGLGWVLGSRVDGEVKGQLKLLIVS